MVFKNKHSKEVNASNFCDNFLSLESSDDLKVSVARFEQPSAQIRFPLFFGWVDWGTIVPSEHTPHLEVNAKNSMKIYLLIALIVTLFTATHASNGAWDAFSALALTKLTAGLYVPWNLIGVMDRCSRSRNQNEKYCLTADGCEWLPTATGTLGAKGACRARGVLGLSAALNDRRQKCFEMFRNEVDCQESTFCKWSRKRQSCTASVLNFMRKTRFEMKPSEEIKRRVWGPYESKEKLIEVQTLTESTRGDGILTTASVVEPVPMAATIRASHESLDQNQAGETSLMLPELSYEHDATSTTQDFASVRSTVSSEPDWQDSTSDAIRIRRESFLPSEIADDIAQARAKAGKRYSETSVTLTGAVSDQSMDGVSSFDHNLDAEEVDSTEDKNLIMLKAFDSWAANAREGALSKKRRASVLFSGIRKLSEEQDFMSAEGIDVGADEKQNTVERNFMAAGDFDVGALAKQASERDLMAEENFGVVENNIRELPTSILSDSNSDLTKQVAELESMAAEQYGVSQSELDAAIEHILDKQDGIPVPGPVEQAYAADDLTVSNAVTLEGSRSISPTVSDMAEFDRLRDSNVEPATNDNYFEEVSLVPVPDALPIWQPHVGNPQYASEQAVAVKFVESQVIDRSVKNDNNYGTSPVSESMERNEDAESISSTPVQQSYETRPPLIEFERGGHRYSNFNFKKDKSSKGVFNQMGEELRSRLPWNSKNKRDKDEGPSTYNAYTSSRSTGHWDNGFMQKRRSKSAAVSPHDSTPFDQGFRSVTGYKPFR